MSAHRTIVLFEDDGWRDLYPLTLARPVYELRYGISVFLTKAKYTFDGSKILLHMRKYLQEVEAESRPEYQINDLSGVEGPFLFLNGRLIYTNETHKLAEGGDAILVNGDGELIGARISSVPDALKNKVENGEPLTKEDFGELPTEEVNAKLFHHLWELVHENGSEIVREYERFGKKGIYGKVYDGAHLVGDEIFVGEGAVIQPGVVLDAEEGPIYIDEGAVIMANSTVVGPAFIGKGSKIKIGAKIYENVSIGPICKIGSEVDESIVHSYANKQHDGFLGHAYVAPWVNLGAGVSNSDLKNNYSTVKVFLAPDRKVNTGSMFVGLMIGDHSKAGINTMFNTGTVVGVAANVFGAGFPPKFVPSFAWGGASGFVPHQFDKAVETARRVMARRKVELTDAYRRMLQHIFEMTADERKDF